MAAKAKNATRKKIAVFEIEGWERAHLRKHLKDHDVSFHADPLTDANAALAKDAQIVSPFIYSRLSAAALKAMPRLELVVTRSTGFDHIDLAACKKRGIRIYNVPTYGENTVAEHTFALILALSRNVHKAYLKSLRRDYSIDGLMGFDLKGKTLGVIGAGHIGLHVIRIGKGFGMNVLAFDVRRQTFLAEVMGFAYASLDDILRQSDIICLLVPHNQHTHHLINRNNIGLIKKGAILINTSRGGVVETEALLEALDKKILAGAGLDVLEGEAYMKEEQRLLNTTTDLQKMAQVVHDNILISKENVVFTPHIAFFSREAIERILDTTTQNIAHFLAGRDTNRVG